MRIATFNVHNLFTRFRFNGKRYKKPDGHYAYRPYTAEELEKVAKDGWLIDKTYFDEFTEAERGITAEAIKATDADILALQEVESMVTLRHFKSQRLDGCGYKYFIVIDGNDHKRLIDVALLGRYKLGAIHTHQFDRNPGQTQPIFSRDCLEADVEIEPGKILPVFVNHFKSMLDFEDEANGRANTMAKRKEQADQVVTILTGRFGDDPGAKPWVVLGDLNDYMPSWGLEPLVSRPWLENIVATRIANPDEQWTHFQKGENPSGSQDEYNQLDYILLSRRLAEQNPGGQPTIIRDGLCLRAAKYTGHRFTGVGDEEPAASDHCPVVMEINL